MKKLLVLTASAFALSALPAMAQAFPSPNHKNSAMISQIGNLNEATIDQAVNGVINGQAYAEIIQSSNRGTGDHHADQRDQPAARRFCEYRIDRPAPGPFDCHH